MEEGNRRPLIGITCSAGKERNAAGELRGYQKLNSAYVKAVEKSGGMPVVIPNGLDEETLYALADRLDGFVISGGGDVDPRCYGKVADETVMYVSEERDRTELALLSYVLHSTKKPVFGICRGMQILNVAMGGTLIIDLPKAGRDEHSLTGHPRGEFTHTIEAEEGSRLKKILGDERGVNSFHHQAIDELGEGLAVSAYSSNDRVIEAVEAPGDRYILAVQWHPEELIDCDAHRRLFEELVKQAREG